MSVEAVAVEKAALVGTLHGCNTPIFRSTCEVLDTEDPEVKIFRFKDGCNWGSTYAELPKPTANQIKYVSVYAFWKSDFEVGEKEGTYRITSVLEAPDGYVAAFEGTTKPKPVEQSPAPVSDSDTRCEAAILTALDSEPRLTLRELRRKISAHRYPAFDACLKRLADEGELKIEQDAKRTWITLSATVSEGCISGSTGTADTESSE